MKYLLIILLFLSLIACSTTREVILPDGTIYTVNALKDDMVVLKLSKEGDINLTMDGRGRPSIFEQALGIMFMNLPDVEIVKD